MMFVGGAMYAESQINSNEKIVHGYEHINILSFTHPRPGLKETLSPISSAPQRVCLCDSHGNP